MLITMTLTEDVRNALTLFTSLGRFGFSSAGIVREMPLLSEDSSANQSRQSSASGTHGNTSLKVIVKYFEMSQFVEVKEEYFFIQSPGNFGQLLEKVVSKHPHLSGIIRNLCILVDGYAPRDDMPIKDRDEVDFILMEAGG